MRDYFSKAEDETSEAMTLHGNRSGYEKMKMIVRAYATKRECSA